MKKTQAVGIDLGTTYSCIAWLNEYGQPVTIPNQEGELATPSVVFFDGHQPVVGTEALRNSISHPDRVVQHAKRFMGDPLKFWKIDNTRYSPVHISGMIIRKLVSAAQEMIGEIAEAVITVPAQFSDAQRHATMQAGHAAGLERIEMINEPVAAALCHVLGNEGLAFTELAVDQQLLVYDLGGGTLDLAVVKYSMNEVRVVASDGDLELGGLDWTQVLVEMAAERFAADFGTDPRGDKESLQFLSLEAEQAKRSLSVRPRAAITVQHARHRRTYQIDLADFERGCNPLVKRAEAITKRILSQNKMGWAHIDVVLTTGGASRMPMVRDSLKKLSGRTLNTSLSPDQSIAHGAAYYAGMLLANQQYTRTVFNSLASARLAKVRQQSVSARSLGILIRDSASGQRTPHYLIPANSPLPAASTHVFGTVVAGQSRVHVRIVESGAGPEQEPTVLGDCEITDLPDNLPEGSEVEVTISYDRQARVHVSARDLVSGKSTEVEIIRQENLDAQLEQVPPSPRTSGASSPAVPAGSKTSLPPAAASSAAGSSAPATRRPASTATAASSSLAPASKPAVTTSAPPKVVAQDQSNAILDPLKELSQIPETQFSVEDSDQPVLLCNRCGAAIGKRPTCPDCGYALPPLNSREFKSSARSNPPSSGTAKTKSSGPSRPAPSPAASASNTSAAKPGQPGVAPPHPAPQRPVTPKPGVPKPAAPKPGTDRPHAPKPKPGPGSPKPKARKPTDPEEAEFWDLVDGDV